MVHTLNWDLRWTQINLCPSADEHDNSLLVSYTSFWLEVKHPSEGTIYKTHFWVEVDFKTFIGFCLNVNKYWWNLVCHWRTFLTDNDKRNWESSIVKDKYNINWVSCWLSMINGASVEVIRDWRLWFPWPWNVRAVSFALPVLSYNLPLLVISHSWFRNVFHFHCLLKVINCFSS